MTLLAFQLSLIDTIDIIDKNIIKKINKIDIINLSLIVFVFLFSSESEVPTIFNFYFQERKAMFAVWRRVILPLHAHRNTCECYRNLRHFPDAEE